jgi:hypothetical protein
MKTTMTRILTTAALVSLPFGAAKADPWQNQSRGGYGAQPLIQIEDDRDFRSTNVEIWTDQQTYFEGEEVNITVTVDHPSFVTVYNIDALGRVQRLTRDSRGVWVTPGRPLFLPQSNHTRFVAAGPGGEEEVIAVASPAQFGQYDLPYFGDADVHNMPMAGNNRGLYIQEVNSRLLQRQCEPGFNEARASFWVRPYPRYRYPIRTHTGIYFDIGFQIPVSSRVYVDGAYWGVGPSCLSRLTPGAHKVTVQHARGKKFTRRVEVPSNRYRSEVRYDTKDGRYGKRR